MTAANMMINMIAGHNDITGREPAKPRLEWVPRKANGSVISRYEVLSPIDSSTDVSMLRIDYDSRKLDHECWSITIMGWRTVTREYASIDAIKVMAECMLQSVENIIERMFK